MFVSMFRAVSTLIVVVFIADIVSCFAVSVGALRSAAIVRLVLTLTFAMHAGVPTLLKSAHASCEASSEYLYFCSCLSFDPASCLMVSGHASTQICVH